MHIDRKLVKDHHYNIPYFLDWNVHVLLVSSEFLAGVVFEGAFYSRARSIPFSLSVTKFFSKHNNFKFNGFILFCLFSTLCQIHLLRKLLQHHRHR